MEANERADLDAEPTKQSDRAWGAQEWLVVALFACLVTAWPTRHCLWRDEASSTDHVNRPFLQTLVHDPNHPGGYYGYLWAWTRLFGREDVSVRLASAPLAVLAIVVALLLGRRLVGRRAALIGGLLLAVSPFCLLYCRMVRYFSLMLLLTPLCVLLLLRARETRQWRDWILWGVSAAAVAYTEYVSPLIIIVISIWFVIRHRRDGPMLRQWLAGALVALCLYAPWLGVLYRHVQVISGHGSGELQSSAGGMLVKLLLPFYSLAVGETTEPWRWPIAVAGAIAFAVLAVFGLRALRRENADAAGLAGLVVVGGSLVGCAVLSTVAQHTPVSRASSLVIFIAPFAYAVAGRGVTALPRLGWQAAGLSVMLAVSAYGVVNYFRGEQFLNPGYAVDWRAIAAYIEERDDPADVWMTLDEPSVGRYYRGRATHRWPSWDWGPGASVLRLADEVQAAGGRIWMVRRDRGFREVVEELDAMRGELERAGWHGTWTGFEALSPTSVRFRERLLGRPVSADYVRVWRFDPPADDSSGTRRDTTE